MKREQNRDPNETHWQRGGMLANGQTGDDVGGMAGFGSLRDFPHRRVGCGRVVVGDDDDNAGHHQADD